MSIKTREELIGKYIEFFKKKGHIEIPSSSLIPENDPTVLFTTAGMHPLVPFILGEKHPLGKRLVNVQKCIRTQDIEEVGDEYHHTFFEMLGNWSLGDYFKEESINYSFEFLTKELKIPKERLGVSVFLGNNQIPKDEESARIWEKLGIPKERIVFLPEENNWWGPAGKTGPCGPDTEIFFYSGEEVPKEFDPNDKNWIEIWNNVFMEYNKTLEGKYEILRQKNVDTGMGVERTLAVLNKTSDNYQTSILNPTIKKIEKISGKLYERNKREMRIIADHIRAAVFISGDERGVKPSNIGQGYILRRLIRRAIRYGKILGINKEFTSEIVTTILESYQDYKEVISKENLIKDELKNEERKFNSTLEKGIKKFNEIANKINSEKRTISGKEAFLLFQSYGFPIEFTKELADERNILIDLEDYKKEFEKHQELSRTTSSGLFKSGLADNNEQTKRLHTATHLLNQALRVILKDNNIKQRGSNITPERLRFDFNFPRKLETEEIKKIEDLVNNIIKQNLPVKKEKMPLSKAIKSGAQAEFGTKYPEVVYVYSIGNFSKEICSGPHVKNTKELGHFKIIKEESVASGVRRIKAILEEK